MLDRGGEICLLDANVGGLSRLSSIMIGNFDKTTPRIRLARSNRRHHLSVAAGSASATRERQNGMPNSDEPGSDKRHRHHFNGTGGVTALIDPTTIPSDIVRFEALMMLAFRAALLLPTRTGLRTGRLEGGTLLARYGHYLFMLWPAGIGRRCRRGPIDRGGRLARD